MTVAGLCKLIELGCNGDETMKALQYSKKIELTSSGRQTRSKTKGKEEFVQVPWLSHAMMILTTEWAGQKERDAQNDEDYEDEDDEDYDEEYDGGKVEELNLGLIIIIFEFSKNLKIQVVKVLEFYFLIF